MTDLEMVRACAEAMGFLSDGKPLGGRIFVYADEEAQRRQIGAWFAPLHSDEWAMTLVKRFRLTVETVEVGAWIVSTQEALAMHGEYVDADSDDLNRAICLCVAKMQQARGTNATASHERVRTA